MNIKLLELNNCVRNNSIVFDIVDIVVPVSANLADNNVNSVKRPYLLQ